MPRRLARPYPRVATRCRRLVEEPGIPLASPDGTPDQTLKQFWNATDV